MKLETNINATIEIFGTVAVKTIVNRMRNDPRLTKSDQVIRATEIKQFGWYGDINRTGEDLLDRKYTKINKKKKQIITELKTLAQDRKN